MEWLYFQINILAANKIDFISVSISRIENYNFYLIVFRFNIQPTDQLQNMYAFNIHSVFILMIHHLVV